MTLPGGDAVAESLGRRRPRGRLRSSVCLGIDWRNPTRSGTADRSRDRRDDDRRPRSRARPRRPRRIWADDVAGATMSPSLASRRVDRAPAASASSAARASDGRCPRDRARPPTRGRWRRRSRPRSRARPRSSAAGSGLMTLPATMARRWPRSCHRAAGRRRRARRGRRPRAGRRGRARHRLGADGDDVGDLGAGSDLGRRRRDP